MYFFYIITDPNCFTEADVGKVLEKEGVNIDKLAASKNKWPIIMKGEIVTGKNIEDILFDFFVSLKKNIL